MNNSISFLFISLLLLLSLLSPQILTKTYLHNSVDENVNLIYDFLSEQRGQQLYNKFKNI